eukprot:3125251-Amphidinium_carterae.1
MQHGVSPTTHSIPDRSAPARFQHLFVLGNFSGGGGGTGPISVVPGDVQDANENIQERSKMQTTAERNACQT